MDILYYILCGLVWAALFEWIDDHQQVKALGPNDIWPRVILIVLWPLMIMIFIIALIFNNRPPNSPTS